MSRARALLVTCITSVVLGLAFAPFALADGDPASDYLLSGASFLSPYDGKIPAAEQAKINAMLASAKQQGLPLKLALIATPYDLGSVPILFNVPQKYAKFLGLEDYYYWRDELIVVMPKGYGIYKAKGLPAADEAAIKALPPPTTKSGTDTTPGEELALAAERALTAVAAKHGITLSTSASSSSGGSGSSVWTERGEIVGGAAVLCAIGFGVWYFRRRRPA